jgi:hypothetical protein
MSGLPAHVARHFPDGIDLADAAGRGAAIARLLEDGDRADLAWLAATVGRAEIARWFARHGARRLSRRSRALWAAVFDSESTPERAGAPASPPPLAASLWPLA